MLNKNGAVSLKPDCPVFESYMSIAPELVPMAIGVTSLAITQAIEELLSASHAHGSR
jgi:hypothetical protein